MKKLWIAIFFMVQVLGFAQAKACALNCELSTMKTESMMVDHSCCKGDLSTGAQVLAEQLCVDTLCLQEASQREFFPEKERHLVSYDSLLAVSSLGSSNLESINSRPGPFYIQTHSFFKVPLYLSLQKSKTPYLI